MLDLDAIEARALTVAGAAPDDVIALIAALRAVLDTTVEEVMRAPWPEDFLVGVDPHLGPRRILILWTLAYLKRKAGVTP